MLGTWIGASFFMVFIQVQSVRSPNMVLNAPMAPAAKMVQTLGLEQTRILLNHFAAEETRHNLYLWEEAQLVLGLVLGFLLIRATQMRLAPVVLCAIMLVFVMFQRFAVTPELVYRGRETDFPPGQTALGPVARVWLLQEVQGGTEIAKLLTGGVLAVYLFTFRTSRRKREEADDLNATYQGRVIR